MMPTVRFLPDTGVTQLADVNAEKSRKLLLEIYELSWQRRAGR
jgi:hypothetical protein